MVKLVNFFEFSALNNLRHMMEAELIKEFKFDTGISLLDEDFIKRLGDDGVEIDSLDEIDFRSDATLGFRGQRVLIYIRDVSAYRHEISLPKFHVSTCKTLVDMWQRKRSERYVLYQRENGIFQINLMRDGKVDVRQEKLNVCRNCLDNLNWNNYSENKLIRNKIVDEFSISQFFEKFPKSLLSVTPSHTADTAPLNDYSTNWTHISKEAKRKAGYKCQNSNCQIDLAGAYSQYLHVHHLDGQKNNNRKQNLKVLCVKCHADEPNHGHMKHGRDYKQFLRIYEQVKQNN
ncbi:hypothetical protein QM435_05035 [Legionella pneumophila]|nr:hypothetical protein [Legionella pneumophila]MDI9844516.1 hypothetical protein [Legionella pneumophila]